MSSADYTTKCDIRVSCYVDLGGYSVEVHKYLTKSEYNRLANGDEEEYINLSDSLLEQAEDQFDADLSSYPEWDSWEWFVKGNLKENVQKEIDAEIDFVKESYWSARYRREGRFKRLVGYARRSRITFNVQVRVRSRARRVRRAGRHVSRSFVTAGIDSGGGGDDGGGDGDGQSDCHRVAFAHSRKAQFVVVSARFGGLSLNDRINTIATRKRALPAQERGARGGGRFFIPLRRWAA